MNGDESDWGQTLSAVADNGIAPEATDRVLVNLRRKRRRRLAARILSAGLGVAVAGTSLAWFHSQSHAPRSLTASQRNVIEGTLGGPSDSFQTREPGQPCVGAKFASSISKLQTGVKVYAAAGHDVTRAWTCGTTPVVMYGQIQVSYEPGWADVDAQEKWTDYAADYGGSVQTVQGYTAFVSSDQPAATRNAVMFVVGDTLVLINADKTVPATQLLQLASSLALPAA